MKNKDLNSLNSLAAAGRRWVSYPVSFGPNPILFTIQFTIQSSAPLIPPAPLPEREAC